MQGQQNTGRCSRSPPCPAGLTRGCTAPSHDAQHQRGPCQNQRHKMPAPYHTCPHAHSPGSSLIPAGCLLCPSQVAPGCSTACLGTEQDKTSSRPQRGSEQNPQCSSLVLGAVTVGTLHCHHLQPHTEVGSPRLQWGTSRLDEVLNRRSRGSAVPQQKSKPGTARGRRGARLARSTRAGHWPQNHR